MTISRPVWISIATVSAILVVAGTVWWLRARSLKQLPVFTESSNTAPQNGPTPPASAPTEAATAIKASDEIVNRPVFFAPEPQVSPGINIVYPTEAELLAATTSAIQAPNPSVSAPSASSVAVDPGEGDPDQDGLTNNQEDQLGTDSNKKDSDQDTLTDGEEVKKYRTDPKKADTDGDGYTDAEEIKNGYNPVGTGKCLTSDCAF